MVLAILELKIQFVGDVGDGPRLNCKGRCDADIEADFLGEHRKLRCNLLAL